MATRKVIIPGRDWANRGKAQSHDLVQDGPSVEDHELDITNQRELGVGEYVSFSVCKDSRETLLAGRQASIVPTVTCTQREELNPKPYSPPQVDTICGDLTVTYPTFYLLKGTINPTHFWG